jgi:hypothetical protein
MNSRTTLFLVVLVALVGGFVLWDHHKGTTTEQREAKRKRILDFDPKDVTGLDLVRSNQTVILEKSGDNWDMLQPLAVRADNGAVNAILDELEFAERIRTISEEELPGVSLVDFGLDPPVTRVTLHSKKRPVGLLVGRETPTKDALYVQVEGRKEVCVAGKSIQERLNQTVETLRSRTAVEFSPAAVTRLEIKAADRIIELSRAAMTTNVEVRWTLTRPLVARADQNKVSELLTDLSGLRVQDFVSEDAKDAHTYLLDEPEREVTVFTGDTGTILVLGRPLTNDASKVYAKLKTGHSIFTVSADAAHKFATQINELRDPRVMTFAESAVKGIEILHDANKIALTGDDKGWHVTAPVAVAGDDDAIRQFLRDLGSLRATQFVADVATDLDAYGLAAPGMTVSLSGDGTNLLAELLVGGLDASNEIRFVKRASEPFVYGVATNALDFIPRAYSALRRRQVLDLKPEQIESFTSGDNVAVREQGTWKLQKPANGVLNVDVLNHAVDAFCKLRAESFESTLEKRVPCYEVSASGGNTNYGLCFMGGLAASDACELSFKLSEPVMQTLTNAFVVVPTNAPAATP